VTKARAVQPIERRILAIRTAALSELCTALLMLGLIAACGGGPVVAEPMHFEWSETLERSAASVPSNSTVEMVFHLPVGMDDPRPLPVRMIGPEGQAQTLEATFVAETLDRVHITVDGSWLVPGRHIIELKTREHAALPLRRYAVVIK